ncbi:MAG: hypothetical protein JWP97_4153 [Labilithrix sp.]|nr:hypothetical protein [Labilithrix sp.]
MKIRVAVAGAACAWMVCSAASAQAQEAQSPPNQVTYEPQVPNETPVAIPHCGLLRHRCGTPQLTLAVEGGLSTFNEGSPFDFNNGTGSVTALGPSWGARVGVQVLSWLAFDAHYIGMNNHANGVATPNGAVSLLTNAINAEVRFTVPIKYVQPYLFTGAGYYNTSVTGSDAAKAASPLESSHELGIPIGLGFGIPLTNGLSLGAELTYHRLFGEAFAADDAIGGGDLTTLNAVARASF